MTHVTCKLIASSCGLCHSDFFHLPTHRQSRLLKQTHLSHHCLNSLLPSSRLPGSSYSLRFRLHQFSLPQLNAVLYKNMFVNRHLLQYIQFYHSSSLHCVFYSSLYCVVSSSLFVLPLCLLKATWLDLTWCQLCSQSSMGYLYLFTHKQFHGCIRDAFLCHLVSFLYLNFYLGLVLIISLCIC